MSVGERRIIIIMPGDDDWYLLETGEPIEPFVAVDTSAGTYANDPAAPVTLEQLEENMRALEAVAPRPAPQPYTFCNAKFTIDGVDVDLDGVNELRWQYARELLDPEPTFGFDWRSLFERRTYECEAVCQVRIRPREWRRFMRSLRRPRTLGASFATLMRRAGYGGRKGRRALRRLTALPDSAWERELK